MLVTRPVGVIGLGGWCGFLLEALHPDATVFEAAPSLEREPLIELSHRPGALIVYHLNVSHSRSLPRHRARVTSELLSHGATVWNAAITDIRKRSIQARLDQAGLPTTRATKEDAVSTPVIVKTNANYGGLPEARLAGLLSLEPRPLPEAMARADALPDYPVLERHLVPDDWWERDDLAIERYVANAQDSFFRVYVVGNRCVYSQGWTPGPVKKMAPGIARCNWMGELHERCQGVSVELTSLISQGARTLNLDFGTLDVVFDESSFYIVDVNTTPFWGRESQSGLLDHLRAAVGSPESRAPR
ncbi:MAG: hypothetical protein KDD11_07280 [Acidobacteria bacterium]|nr:hypothetical protein [Acidobacteriota bacterium]